jgi:hypothetical protein
VSDSTETGEPNQRAMQDIYAAMIALDALLLAIQPPTLRLAIYGNCCKPGSGR